MALRRITLGRERYNVFLIVEFDRPHVTVDEDNDVANALRRSGSHSGEEWMLNDFREPDAHVIGNAWLAGRVDDARSKLRHKYPRLKADTGL